MRTISEKTWRTAIELLQHYAAAIDSTAGVKEANRKRHAALTVKSLKKATKTSATNVRTQRLSKTSR